MESIATSLEFKKYLVNNSTYSINENFKPDEDSDQLEVGFDIEALIIRELGEIQIILTTQVGDDQNANCPFTISVQITGVFGVEGTNNLEDDNFLVPNAVAILFPYLRNVVSGLSVMSNIFPDYRLPLLNAYEFLKDQDQIEVIDNTNRH